MINCINTLFSVSNDISHFSNLIVMSVLCVVYSFQLCTSSPLSSSLWVSLCSTLSRRTLHYLRTGLPNHLRTRQTDCWRRTETLRQQRQWLLSLHYDRNLEQWRKAVLLKKQLTVSLWVFRDCLVCCTVGQRTNNFSSFTLLSILCFNHRECRWLAFCLIYVQLLLYLQVKCLLKLMCKTHGSSVTQFSLFFIQRCFYWIYQLCCYNHVCGFFLLNIKHVSLQQTCFYFFSTIKFIYIYSLGSTSN